MPNATRSYELAALSFLVLAISLYYLKLSVGFYSPTPQHVPSSVDLLSATTADLINGLEDGTFTSFQLISEYQRRIARDNRAGLWLNAMLSTAPEDNVLQIAKQRDDQRKTGLLLGPLHGVPFVVKDIMVTDRSRGMRTTYGAYALQDSVAPNVAFIVQKAEEAGAIVIGKTNLQEMGGFKGSNNAGWSKIGGRTVSPFDFGEPCGSSSGAGVAVSAGFAPVSFGTDTTGSVSCPAAFNSLYGLRPSLGLLSRTGILPTSTSFDTPGLLTKSVRDIALWMDVVAQPDSKDAATIQGSVKRTQSYAKELSGHWKPWRIGVLDRAVFWNESIPLWTSQAQDHQMIKECNETLKRFHNGGASLVEGIELPMAHLSDEDLSVFDKILNYELKNNLDSYLASLENTSVHSVSDLVAWNTAHPDLAYAKGYEGQEALETALETTISKEEYLHLQNKRAALVEAYGLEKVLDEHNLDAVVVPAFTWLVQYNAMGGNPFGVIPVGKYDSGRPFGLGFAGRRFDDAKLLQIMEAAEKTSVKREIPDVFKYGTFLEKIRYWWRRVNPPTRTPDNRIHHESPSRAAGCASSRIIYTI